MYEQTDFLETLDNNFIVSQSIIDVLQECYEDLERGATDGHFSLGYEDGKLVGHNISKEAIQKRRDTIDKIIQWCRQYAHITPAIKVLQVKREERQQTSRILGDCFYDSILLAEEYQAAVVSDDAPFKQLLHNGKTPLPFSTWQLLQYLYANGKLDQNTFETWSIKLVLANYVYIPITGDQLWQAFGASTFQLTKPFTVAIKGFIISRPDVCASGVVQFLKKLYLESGLAITREQTVLYVFNEIAGRKDFEEFKKIFIQHMQTEFRYLPTAKDEIFQLLSAFSRA